MGRRATGWVRVADGVYRRGDWLQVRVYNPSKGQSGRDSYKVMIGADYQAALQRAKDLKAEKDAERAQRRRLGQEPKTVRAWLDVPRDGDGEPIRGELSLWLRMRQREIKESTERYNMERCRRFVAEHGDTYLHDFTELDASAWANDHPGTVMVLRAAFQDAKVLRLVARNPFEHIKGTRARKGLREMPHALVDEELELLVWCAVKALGDYGERVFAPMLDFGAWSGLRSGERYALDVDDVDFADASITVDEQFHSMLGKRTSVKEWEDRKIVLLDRAEAALRRVKPWPKRGAIFRNESGEHLRQSSESWYWQPVRNLFMQQIPADHWLHERVRKHGKRANLSIYELRHFFGTELAHSGCTKWEVADQMGHRDPDVANRYYVHLEGKRVRESVQEKVRAERARRKRVTDTVTAVPVS